MRTTVFRGPIDEEAGNRSQNLVPGLGIPPHHTGCTRRAELIQQLANQVLRNPSVWRIADRPQVAQGQRVVHTHVELHEPADHPVLLASVVPIEQEQLVPLLREYWFDTLEKVKTWQDKLVTGL